MRFCIRKSTLYSHFWVRENLPASRACFPECPKQACTHQPLEHIRADPRTGHPGAVQRLRAWLQAVASQMPASRGPEAVSEPPRPGHAFLTKTFFPFTDGKKFSGSRLWHKLQCDHSNMDMGNFLSWHPSSVAKHLPEKSHVTHGALGKEQCKPF